MHKATDVINFQQVEILITSKQLPMRLSYLHKYSDVSYHT